MEAKQYISYIISEASVEKQEILIAELSDFGFDGFEQSESSLIANAPVDNMNKTEVESFLNRQGVPFTIQIIQEQNWNAQWEQSFEPIIIENFCVVRAAFHPPVEGVRYNIVVTPKMSFGTGHHATTYMMLQAMQHIIFTQKTVIDFGSGTGILAILAEMLGAEKITAIDYDDWCIENGTENVAANNCDRINIIKASGLEEVESADIILANINKHVILSSLPIMKLKLKEDGILLISGLLQADESEILQAALQIGFNKRNIRIRNGWLCICFSLI